MDDFPEEQQLQVLLALYRAVCKQGGTHRNLVNMVDPVHHATLRTVAGYIARRGNLVAPEAVVKEPVQVTVDYTIPILHRIERAGCDVPQLGDFMYKLLQSHPYTPEKGAVTATVLLLDPVSYDEYRASGAPGRGSNLDELLAFLTLFPGKTLRRKTGASYVFAPEAHLKLEEPGAGEYSVYLRYGKHYVRRILDLRSVFAEPYYEVFEGSFILVTVVS